MIFPTKSEYQRSKGGQKSGLSNRTRIQQKNKAIRNDKTTYTALSHPRHAKILQSALTQAKQKIGIYQ